MARHPLLDVDRIPEPIERYLASIGEVFAVITGHDSGNTSYGVRVGAERFFVKHADTDDAAEHLESAAAFHAAVRHPVIIPLLAMCTTPSGRAVVHPWVDGEVLYDARVPNVERRGDSATAWSRFRARSPKRIVAAVATIIEAHVAVARQGFVAVDFYDGCVIVDLEADTDALWLCDLDLYRPGPFTLARDRQLGSGRFMAPEEWQRGAVVDERTTVFNLGRAAFVFLSSGLRGETDRTAWRADAARREVALRACAWDPRDRWQAVAELARAWASPSG